MLLVTITIDGVVFRGSTRGFAGQYYYHNWVKQMPTLELGQVQVSGKIGVQFGQLVITNDFNNPDHPFFSVRYEDLLEVPKLFSTSLQYSESGKVLFDGEIYLTGATETDLTFTLTDKAYETGAREMTLSESFAFVEGVAVPGSGLATQITAPNHGFTAGQFVVFEKMNSIGETLEYVGPPTDNFYVVASVLSSDVFSIQDKEFVPVSENSNVGTTGTITSDGENHRVGLPQRVPFSWGVLQNVTPVIKKRSDEVCNPNLDISDSNNPIEIRENGVLVYSTAVTSLEYWNGANGSGVAPTSKTIKLNQDTAGGTLSISGASTRGTTLEEFFEHVAIELGLTADLTKTTTT